MPELPLRRHLPLPPLRLRTRAACPGTAALPLRRPSPRRPPSPLRRHLSLRSPYYALAYAANDLVLIVLWVIAALTDISTVPMVACFVMFFANDLYGFINWRRMEKQQAGEPPAGRHA